MLLDQIETGSFGEANGIARSLRVVSWNINRGLQFEAIVEFLAEQNADLILLQECDVNAQRTGRRNVARDIAAMLGMNYAFAIEFQELTQSRNGSAAFHGQATLCRWPLLNARPLRFRTQSGFWRPHWLIPNFGMFQRRVGGRVALVTCTRMGERTLVVYNLHLESRGNDPLRKAQVFELLADIDQCSSDMPVVIAGDFNVDLKGQSVSSLLDSVSISNPFSHSIVKTIVSRSSARSGAIDWILTKGPVSARSPQVHSSVFASDHFPLTLVLDVSGANL